jgi:hypothetical protein
MLSDPGNMEPSSANTVEAAANIARQKRSIQSIRVVILPQVVVATDSWNALMPVTF